MVGAGGMAMHASRVIDGSGRAFSWRFSGSRCGFTLIELLAVIAIVSVLSAMLLPGLNRAKGLAKRVNCLSNARQLSMAVMLYGDDNYETFPPSADYGTPTDDPRRVWTMKVIPYVDARRCSAAPALWAEPFPRTGPNVASVRSATQRRPPTILPEWKASRR